VSEIFLGFIQRQFGIATVVKTMGEGDAGEHRARGIPSPSVVKGPEQLSPKSVVFSMMLSSVAFSYIRERCSTKNQSDWPLYVFHRLVQQSNCPSVLLACMADEQSQLNSNGCAASATLDVEFPDGDVLTCPSEVGFGGFVSSVKG
jgi:hypothetical protein